MVMNLAIRDDPALEGTSKVAIRSQDLDQVPPQPDRGALLVVRLRHGTRTCGAVVSAVLQGDESILLADSYLRLHLGAKPDGTVEVEFFQPVEARTVRLATVTRSSSLEAQLRGSLLGRPVVAGQKIPLFNLIDAGVREELELLATEPAGIVIVVPDTDISIEKRAEKVGQAGITYDSIGGLKRELTRIRELLEIPLRSPEVMENLGIDVPRGIILHGPPGTGKTLIAKALSNEVGAKFYSIQGPEIMSAYFSESERRLRELFEKARASPPAVVLIDELDSIVPSRDKTVGETEHRMVATLLSLMDGLTEMRGVVVIGTTNRLNAIDPALIRAGRFDHLIHIGPPDKAGRADILRIHTGRMNRRGTLAQDVDIEALAEKTPGYVGADLALLAREAAYSALKRCVPEEKLEKGDIAAETLEAIKVCQDDFLAALGIIRPSAMREVMVQVPRDVTWESVGGLEGVKQTLIESVIYGIKKPEAFKPLGIKPAKGLLLYGPPGTGKSLLAKAVANECGGQFILVRGPELRSKWFGESEERVRFIFAKAREVAPCVIFFDEIDALAPTRGRDASGLTDSIVNQMLTEFDGLHGTENVFVLGATNLPDLVDPALLRPGRFDRQIYVPLPDAKGRESIFAVYLRQNTRLAKDVSTSELAEITEGLSGADIEEVCYQAGRQALRRASFDPSRALVSMDDYRQAVADVKETQKRVKPRIGFKLPGQET